MGDRAFAAAVRQHLDGDLGAAIGGYRRVLASDPNHADALNNLGGALMRHERGSAAEAEHVQARAVQLRPTYTDAYVNLGVCRREAGALRGALTAFASAAALNPDTSAAYERMGAAVRASHAAGSAGPQKCDGVSCRRGIRVLRTQQQQGTRRPRGKFDEASTWHAAGDVLRSVMESLVGEASEF